MGSTPTYALPYPELTDSANVPRDMKANAEAVEAAIGAAKEKVQPYCLAVASVAQNMTTGTEVALVFNSAEQNSPSMWTAANPSDIILPSDGLYMFVLGFSFAAVNTGGSRIAILRIAATLNGTYSSIRGWQVGQPGTTSAQTGTITYTRQCVAGNAVRLHHYQSAGVTVATSNQSYPLLGVYRMGTP